MTAPRRRAQLRVCIVCGRIKVRSLDQVERVIPGAIDAVVCMPCWHVARDLVRALGRPPDSPSSASSSEITGEVRL